MSKVILELNNTQVTALVGRLSLKDKIQLAQKLNQETWQAQFKNIISQIDQRLKYRRRLSNTEIVQIVKKVRKRNYAPCCH